MLVAVGVQQTNGRSGQTTTFSYIYIPPLCSARLERPSTEMRRLCTEYQEQQRDDHEGRRKKREEKVISFLVPFFFFADAVVSGDRTVTSHRSSRAWRWCGRKNWAWSSNFPTTATHYNTETRESEKHFSLLASSSASSHELHERVCVCVFFSWPKYNTLPSHCSRDYVSSTRPSIHPLQQFRYCWKWRAGRKEEEEETPFFIDMASLESFFL